MECVNLFRQVPMDMLNEPIYINVLNGCSHCGLTNEAKEIFEKIPSDKRTNKIYTTLVKDAMIIKFLLINQCSDRRFKSFVQV